MQRDVLDLVEGVLEHGRLPTAEGRHVAARGAAGGELDASDRPTSSSWRPRWRRGRTRGPSWLPSAKARPSRCRGTRTSRRAAAPSRARGAGPTASCRPGGCSTRRDGARRRRPRVPRLTASMGSTPALRHQSRTRWCRSVFVSVDSQARSRRRGRSATGPTPSSQL